MRRARFGKCQSVTEETGQETRRVRNDAFSGGVRWIVDLRGDNLSQVGRGNTVCVRSAGDLRNRASVVDKL